MHDYKAPRAADFAICVILVNTPIHTYIAQPAELKTVLGAESPVLSLPTLPPVFLSRFSHIPPGGPTANRML